MDFSSARLVSIALHLAADAQRLLQRAELNTPPRLVPALLRELADRLEKDQSEDSKRPAV